MFVSVFLVLKSNNLIQMDSTINQFSLKAGFRMIIQKIKSEELVYTYSY